MYKNKIILGTANLSNGYGLENKKFKNHNDLKKYLNILREIIKGIYRHSTTYGKSEKVLGRVFDKKSRIYY